MLARGAEKNQNFSEFQCFTIFYNSKFYLDSLIAVRCQGLQVNNSAVCPPILPHFLPSVSPQVLQPIYFRHRSSTLEIIIFLVYFAISVLSPIASLTHRHLQQIPLLKTPAKAHMPPISNCLQEFNHKISVSPNLHCTWISDMTQHSRIS